MKFLNTPIPGVILLEQNTAHDGRGSFSRTFCQNELSAEGINFAPVQCNSVVNTQKGTLRGMHFQRAPRAEGKIVWCFQGAVWDVVLDLRPDSPTYLWHHGFELSAANGRMVYIPKGLAHGYLTLAANTSLFYWMDEIYDPSCSAGVRWNDPAFGIVWPSTESLTMAERDRNYPDFKPAKRTAA